MFLKHSSVHGRRMGELRSAQQKCARRVLVDGMSLVHLEHLLTTPDYSRAAMDRAVVIAAEDVGAGSPDLVRVLVDLRSGWKTLTHTQRAKHLLGAAQAVCQHPMSRFVPHWVIHLMLGVDSAQDAWRTREELRVALEDACAALDRDAMGLIAEEAMLRTTLRGETPLPDPIALPAEAMDDVWEALLEQCSAERRPMMRAWRKEFGPPSKRDMSSRLFLYLAVVDLVHEPEVPEVELPELTDDDVAAWLDRAASEAFDIPEWMYDKHTHRGRSSGQGQTQFFDEATRLEVPSEVLGAEREERMREQCAEAYLELERQFGRKSRSKHVRARWRDAARSAA